VQTVFRPDATPKHVHREVYFISARFQYTPSVSIFIFLLDTTSKFFWSSPCTPADMLSESYVIQAVLDQMGRQTCALRHVTQKTLSVEVCKAQNFARTQSGFAAVLSHLLAIAKGQHR
jgi:hypothetical protein